MAKYFVTTSGLAAAVTDEAVLQTLKQILRGEAPHRVIQECLDKGYVGIDRRVSDNRTDNNLVILSGALDRVRSVLPALPSSSNGGPGLHADEEMTRDMRTVPRKLYKIRPDSPPLSVKELQKLPSGARHVYSALRRSDVGTVKSLAEQTGLNRRTVENAISALRKAKVIVDMDFKR